ncbi:acetyl-CoA carboxylase biotin carboxylase subunit [Variovorax defluvii]|uniref:Biotin carboxylase n=1 Tax=Variovorax defluvii TaxID=913761 RepID=A0ABP8I0X5_9BURK
MTLKSVLVANRGEIALRVIRACRELGIEAVQVYSSADKDSLPVRLADRSICIGGATPAESYLNRNALIQAAQMAKVDAVHPGYGFLSENAEFAEAVIAAGLTYVGPDPQAIRLMGDKAAARKLAMEAGVPVAQGSPDPVADVEEAVRLANGIGYPVLVKASAGGGGRGMRVMESEKQLREGLERASSEAAAAFGSGAVYIERYISPVRHVEVQVVGDGKDVVHFGERDCTIQRRHQKLLEESPSPIVTPQLRERMTKAACDLARSVNYRSAGTLEFIVDAARQEFFFIEMNTRIQVEHPVTEAVTGVDLVKLQLRIAAGEPLPMKQADVRFHGHAIECRINAEDSEKGFLPRPGKITELVWPAGPGVRVDSHAFASYELPPYYDSLVAKLVVWDDNRDAAIARMRRALAELQLSGVKTTREFHQRLLDEPAFAAADVSTQFVKDKMYAQHPMRHML